MFKNMKKSVILLNKLSVKSRRNFFGGTSYLFWLKKLEKVRKYANRTSNFADIH
jgi:hypothetical protein